MLNSTPCYFSYAATEEKGEYFNIRKTEINRNKT